MTPDTSPESVHDGMCWTQVDWLARCNCGVRPAYAGSPVPPRVPGERLRLAASTVIFVATYYVHVEELVLPERLQVALDELVEAMLDVPPREVTA